MPEIPRVLASGKFDLLHPGHIFYLEECEKLYRKVELWVVITHENNIKDNLFTNEERKRMLESLEAVDGVLVGDKHVDFLATIKKVEPDVIALGHDQRPEGLEKSLENYKDEVKIERVKPYRSGKYSSTRFREMLKQH
ncbi:MAG: adenylyltransferase/cytidyltransferase family protein [Candidatus Aenigmatarchaeota archaeon]